MRRRRTVLLLVLVALFALALEAQRLTVGDTVKPFVTVDAPVVALTNVRVIDGTGAAPRANQTIVIQDGNIRDVGDTGRVTIPPGATTLDLSGTTVIPGLVMVHEHLYDPTAPGVYGQLGESFSRLYLAGGVTTLRTGGNVNGVMDLRSKRFSGKVSGSAPRS